jgi:serine/threonine-protein kinase
MSEDQELLEELGAEPGRVIAGKYRVEALLATGGMGAVIRARHEVLEQDVAIKLMRPEVAKRAELAQRFLREARAAAKISSDYVARVTDVDRLADGTPFMVMEYLDGEDLHQVISRDAPLAVEAAVDAVMEGLAGVDAAHRLGIVHRDLKPSNLFVVRLEDGRRRVKVLDFGISKALDEAASSSLKAGATTSTDAILGTPRYMSPEQVSSSKDVDGRTDLWSMGLILYEALSGEYPFVADTAQGLFAEILTEPVVSLRPARAEVPQALEKVLLRCLERARSQRWASARELMVALAPFASNRVRHALLDGQELAIASSQATVAAARAVVTPTPSDPGRAPELVPTVAVRGKERGVDESGRSDPAVARRDSGVAKSAATTSRGRAVDGESSRAAPSTHAEMEVETPLPASKSRVAAIAVAVVASIAAAGALLWPRPPSSVSTDAAAAKDVPVASPSSWSAPAAAPAPTPTAPMISASPSVEVSAAPSAAPSASAAAPHAAHPAGPSHAATAHMHTAKPSKPGAAPSPDSLLDTR